jgi:hypothetical protein
MTRIARLGVLAVFLLPFAPLAANAQGKCPEGKTASGECVNPGFADSMRQAALIFAQPKISFTAFPVLPVQDWMYRYPNQLINDPAARPSANGCGGGRGGRGGGAVC